MLNKTQRYNSNKVRTCQAPGTKDLKISLWYDLYNDKGDNIKSSWGVSYAAFTMICFSVLWWKIHSIWPGGGGLISKNLYMGSIECLNFKAVRGGKGYDYHKYKYQSGVVQSRVMEKYEE